MNTIKAISLVIPIRKNKNKTQLWLQKRNSDDELNGLLEFPGGKIESEEVPIDSAIREFSEEVGLNLKAEDLILTKVHQHTAKDNFLFYIYTTSAIGEQLAEDGWFTFSDKLIDTYKNKIPDENLIFLRDIIKSL